MTINGFPSAANLTPRTTLLKVDPVTGMLRLEVLDYGQWDVGQPFLWKRRYVPEPVGIKSKLKPLGERWQLGATGQAERSRTEIRLPREDFRWEAFLLQENRWLSQSSPANLFLTVQSDSLLLKDLAVPGEYHFDKNNMLILSRRQGLIRRFTYIGTTLSGITLADENEITVSGDKGHIASIKDALGRVLRYEYDGELLKQVIYPNGGQVVYDYDERGLVLSIKDRSGGYEARLRYDDYGRVIRRETAVGEIFNYEYADQDRLTTRREVKSGALRQYFWNRQRKVCRVVYEDGSEIHTEYDREGRVTLRRTRQGTELRYEYDDAGRITKEIFPNVTFTYTYDKLGHLTARQRNDGFMINYTYNGEGYLVKRRTKLSLKDWREEIWDRDIKGRIIAYSLNGQVTRYAYEGAAPFPVLLETATGNKFSYRYDRVNRLLAVRSPQSERTYAYNALDLLAGDTDGLGREKSYAYDLQGVPREGQTQKFWPGFSWPQLRPPVTKEILTAYKDKASCRCDLGGRLLEIRTPDEAFPPERPYRLTRWQYDKTDNILEERLWLDPQDKTSATGRIRIRRFAYDAENRLKRQTDSRGETIEYAYDALGACVQERHLNGQNLTALIRYVYDAIGRLISRDEKSDYQKTGKLWERTDFYLSDAGSCLAVLLPDGSQLAGDKAAAFYAEVQPRRYPDSSGYL